MKRNIIAIMFVCIIGLSLSGCKPEPVQINVSSNENLSSDQFCNFIEISSDLHYDSATRIVYICNQNSYGDVYTPYYAPNGFPYRYNPETNTFEEINNSK